ncbi:MAG: DUF1592 domain-containing protein [Polyangiaceae bacterium]
MAVAAFVLSSGCQSTFGDPQDPASGTGGPSATGRGSGTTGGNATGSTTGGNTGTGTGSGGGTGTGTGTGTGAGGAGGGGAGGAGGAGGSGPTACTGTEVTAAKRLIRLTFNQLVNSIASLVDGTIAAAVATAQSIPDATERSFPPLSSPREGSVITDSQWSKGDKMAVQVAQYVVDNFAKITGCATATDTCAQTFIGTFAEKAYRRPLTADEKTSLTQVYTEVKAAGGTINEGVQFSVNAILETPQFLYRTEFGSDAKQAGPLSQYELASQISYFIGDAPPDAALLTAAQQGKLSTPAELDTQARRLIALDSSKQNLQTAMFAYFGAGNVTGVVIPDVPEFTVGLQNSMYREAVLFVNNTLWGPKVTDLLTSRRTYINTTLASVYGVNPPTGATVDNFVALDLPDTRAGLLTSPGFLVSRSRPDKQSVVGRGLLINATVLCGQNPQFNPDLQGAIDMVSKAQADFTEREKSLYRIKTAPCSGCHPTFDPYGLSLENFDILARYRTADEKGRAIDSSVTLPSNAGGSMAKNGADMAAQVSSNGAFAACLTKNLLLFALAEPVALTTNSCATQSVAKAFAQSSDQSFATLIRLIAASTPVGSRTPGGM